MRSEPNGRETGSALLISITITMLLFGLVASMVISSTTSSLAVSDASDQLEALYVAQAGLAQAKQELALGGDVDDDGLGTVTGKTRGGTYQVIATDLGDNLWQLDAVGTARTSSASLREIVETARVLNLPEGAMSVLGEMDWTRFKLKKDFGLVLDGADSPALAITDATLFDGLSEEFVAAIESGALPLDNLTGGVTTPMDINGVTEDVPIVHTPEYGSALDNLDAFYDELVVGTRNLLPSATKVTELITSGDDTIVLGTPANPVVVHFDAPIFLHDSDRIRGWGTLIVSKELRLGFGTRLDWTGDVIVYSDSSGNADIRVAGEFNVDGNVLVLGESNTSSFFRVDKHTDGRPAIATINGAFLVATASTATKGKKASIRTAGKLIVNGLMMLLGSKVDLWAETGSDINVNGMSVLGVRDGTNQQDLILRFEGDVEMHKDDALIEAAVNSIVEMGERLNLSSIPIFDYSVVSRAWIQSYEGSLAVKSGSTEQTQSGY